MKPTIGSTRYGMALEIDALAKDAAAFLIKHKEVILADRDMDMIKNVRVHTRTPLTDVFQSILQSGNFSAFTAYNLSATRDSIPEALTWNDITVDGKTVAGMPQYLQTAWCNITPLVSKRDAYNSGFYITDIPALSALFTRAALCVSYNDSDGWLNPSMTTFIIESFSSALAIFLRQVFNLQFDEFKLVQTLFAAYYAQLLGSSKDDKMIPSILYRCTFLGKPIEITERMKVFEDVRKELQAEELNIKKCCEVLSKVGPSRMNAPTNFHQDLIYRPFSRAASDSMAMLISLDYPPYWVYQLLSNVYGSKNPMMKNLIDYLDMKTKIVKFSLELSSSKLFIDKVSR